MLPPRTRKKWSALIKLANKKAGFEQFVWQEAANHLYKYHHGAEAHVFYCDTRLHSRHVFFYEEC